MSEEEKNITADEAAGNEAQEESLPLATIIGQAVSQCARAQQASAESMWDYLDQTAFHVKKGMREVAMMQFDFEVEGENLQIRLPLISVLPAQYVQIRDVQVDFNVEIDEDAVMQKAANLKRLCPVKMAPTKQRILRSKRTKHNLHNNISVSIKAGNIDMSGGMARLLEMAGMRGILIRPVEETKKT